MARPPLLPVPPLPVGDIVRKSYQDLLANHEGLVRVGLVWLVVPLVLEMLAGWTATGDGPSLLGLVASLVSFVGLSAIAVVWHRHIIMGQDLVGPLAPVDARVFRYIGFAVLVSLVSAVPAIGAVLVATAILGEGAVEGGGALSLLMAAGFVAAVIMAVRLQLVFPAVAIGDSGMPLRRSWQVTAGNTFRLVSGLILTVLPVLVAAMLAALAGGLFTSIGAPRFGAFVSLLAGNLGGWLQAPLVAAFLSYCYLWFREQGNRPTSLPPLSDARGSR